MSMDPQRDSIVAAWSHSCINVFRGAKDIHTASNTG